MRTSIEILDEARAAAGGTWYALARELNVSEATLRIYRRGRSAIGDEPALRIAALLGEPPEVILAELAAERAQRKGYSQVVQVWDRVVRHLAAGGAAVVLVMVGGALPGDASAQAVDPATVYYVKSLIALVLGAWWCASPRERATPLV